MDVHRAEFGTWHSPSLRCGQTGRVRSGSSFDIGWKFGRTSPIYEMLAARGFSAIGLPVNTSGTGLKGRYIVEKRGSVLNFLIADNPGTA